MTTANGGAVLMTRVNPDVWDVSWNAWAPDGSSLSGDADTDNFASAHSYAQAGRHNLRVDGGGISSSCPNSNVIAFLNATRQTFGPVDSSVYELFGVNFTFAGQGISSGHAVCVDSFSKGKLYFDGQVVCSHDGPAVTMSPTTNYTGDANKNQGVADFFFRVIQQATTSSNAVVWQFNAPDGCSLNGSHYRTCEANGGRRGVEFVTDGTGVIINSKFELWGIHGWYNGTGGVGIDASGALDLKACEIHASLITPPDAEYTAKIRGNACTWKMIDLTTGQVKIHISSATYNSDIEISAPDATGLSLTNNSTAASNRLRFNNTVYL